MSELTNPPAEFKPDDPNWLGVNSVTIYNVDTMALEDYERLHITRWRIVKWWLKRKYPGERVILRRELYGKQELLIDINKSLPIALERKYEESD